MATGPLLIKMMSNSVYIIRQHQEVEPPIIKEPKPASKSKVSNKKKSKD